MIMKEVPFFVTQVYTYNKSKFHLIRPFPVTKYTDNMAEIVKRKIQLSTINEFFGQKRYGYVNLYIGLLQYIYIYKYNTILSYCEYKIG